jgi:hypothetical protein
MGQKINPHGFRIGVIKDWDTKWYANKKNFSDYLVEDVMIRRFIKKKLYISGISRIEIDRAANKIKINVNIWRFFTKTLTSLTIELVHSLTATRWSNFTNVIPQTMKPASSMR